MGLTDDQCAALFAGLEAKGWQWQEDTLYAPQRTFWLVRANPWMHDLENFHSRMTNRLAKIEQQKDWEVVPANYPASASDTRSLLEVLQNLRHPICPSDQSRIPP